MAKKIGFDEWGQQFFNSLIKVYRWGYFKHRTKEETVVEHILKQNIFALTAVLIEPLLTDRDKLIIIGTSIVHDLGEKGYKIRGEKLRFDIPFVHKVGTDKKKMQKMERDRFIRFLNKLDISDRGFRVIKEKIMEMYDCQHEDSLLGNYFNALERLSYIAHALFELRNGNKSYIFVLEKHSAEIELKSKKFWSINEIYSAMRPEVKKFLQFRASP